MSSVGQQLQYVPGLELEDAKELLRSSIRTKRLNTPPKQRKGNAEAAARLVLELPQVQEATCVSVFASRPAEPDTLPLINALHARGIRILIPVLGAGLERDWAQFISEEDLAERAPGRPPEPSGPQLGVEAISQAQVIIVPALAVDTTGARLGQGGGWYDRALDNADPEAVVLALVNSNEVFDAATQPLPQAEHDRRVSGWVTPEGVFWAD